MIPDLVTMFPRKLTLGWIHKNKVQRKEVQVFATDFAASTSHSVAGVLSTN